LATYATGIVYGLQPDALFVVIPALALPTAAAAIAYCVMFVIGTVTAMGGYTLLIGEWARDDADRETRFGEWPGLSRRGCTNSRCVCGCGVIQALLGAPGLARTGFRAVSLVEETARKPAMLWGINFRSCPERLPGQWPNRKHLCTLASVR
jgi:hypothetical protein